VYKNKIQPHRFTYKKQFGKKEKKSKQVSAHALTHHFFKQVKCIKTKQPRRFMHKKQLKKKNQTG
jgi:hypothetical protein